MRVDRLHSWDVDPGEARHIQSTLRRRLRLVPPPPRARLVAGADCAISKDGRSIVAVVIVLELPWMEEVDRATGGAPLTFPYIPGLLSFREGPALIRAFRNLRTIPDIVLFDGQGYAHPARLGLASHIGLWIDVPTVGVAKSRLIGEHRKIPEKAAGYRTLYDRGEPIGRVFRTKNSTKPLYVSPGHYCDLPGAMRITLRCGKGYRLPEPTRIADREVGILAKGS